jgi:hypothetical protein
VKEATSHWESDAVSKATVERHFCEARDGMAAARVVFTCGEEDAANIACGSQPLLPTLVNLCAGPRNL